MVFNQKDIEALNKDAQAMVSRAMGENKNAVFMYCMLADVKTGKFIHVVYGNVPIDDIDLGMDHFKRGKLKYKEAIENARQTGKDGKVLG